MSEDMTAIETRRPIWRRRWFVIAMITTASILIHAWLVWQLPVDADEPTYLNAASDYARLIRAGDLRGIIDYPINREHPPLGKIIYSLPYLLVKPEYGALTEMYINRGISALFGVLTVLFLSIVNPLAGGFLALHSMTLKYTSEVYLEALPMLASTVAVLTFEKSRQGNSRWLWISAIALGAAAAGKYTYLIVLIPIAVMALWKRTIPWKLLAFYVVTAVLVFFALDPSLWADPFRRLWDSLFFHAQYSQSTHVKLSPYPWYQPVIWVSNPVPWHPQVFFFPTSDEVVAWLALPALYLERKRRPWLLAWLAVGMAMLLLWPTKWPQYALIVTVALCLLAAATVKWVVDWVREENKYWDWLEEMLPHPSRVVWIVLAGFVLVLFSGKVVNEIRAAAARRDWISVAEGITPLPSNTVYAIARGGDNRMLIATSAGVAVWAPSEEAPWGGSSQVFTTRNSGLPSDRVSCAYADSHNNWWFCSDRGISRYDGSNWETFSQGDMGLPTSPVRAVEEDSMGGLWVATLQGASYWDGNVWHSYPSDGASLPKAALFDLAVQHISRGDWIWFGTGEGIIRYDTATQTWEKIEGVSRTAASGGVNDLLVDSENRLWAATSGGGLGIWDGTSWHFSLSSDSDIPYNHVQSLFEEAPGILWAGFSFGTEPGGIVARFDGKTWTRFTPKNSGYSGGEPYTIMSDESGRIWIGQAAGGLMIFKNPRRADKP